MMNQERRLLLAPFAAAVLVLTGCGSSISRDTFKLTPELQRKKELRTRRYEATKKGDILSASAGVLQDLGFVIYESETQLGLITGSKQSDAKVEAGWYLRIPGRNVIGDGLDNYQKFWASVVIRPISKNDETAHDVSVSFLRIVWDASDVVIKREILDEPEMYQEFFDRLSKSVFLEGHKF